MNNRFFISPALDSYDFLLFPKLKNYRKSLIRLAENRSAHQARLSFMYVTTIFKWHAEK